MNKVKMYIAPLMILSLSIPSFIFESRNEKHAIFSLICFFCLSIIFLRKSLKLESLNKDISSFLKEGDDSSSKKESLFSDILSEDLVHTVSFLGKTSETLNLCFEDQKSIQARIEKNNVHAKSLVSKVEVEVRAAASNSEKAKEKAKDGAEKIEELQSSLNSLARVEDSFVEFNEMVQKISKGMESIQEVVRFSKLVSFNASIEAAKYDKSGTFSVVSSEMTKFAESISATSLSIQDMLEESVQQISFLRNEVEESIEFSSNIIIDSKSSFSSIVDEIFELTSGIESITTNLNNYTSSINENEATIGQVNRAASSLGIAASNVKLVELNLGEVCQSNNTYFDTISDKSHPQYGQGDELISKSSNSVKVA